MQLGRGRRHPDLRAGRVACGGREIGNARPRARKTNEPIPWIHSLRVGRACELLSCGVQADEERKIMHQAEPNSIRAVATTTLEPYKPSRAVRSTHNQSGIEREAHAIKWRGMGSQKSGRTRIVV